VTQTRILVLCTGNSCRSQMAEGFLKHLFGGRVEAFSAGSRPSGTVHPLAIKAMAEIGIDISGGRSKSMREYLSQHFDFVLTVCDSAKEECPVYPGRVTRLHQSFDDPAEAEGTEEERMQVFRRVRDEIKTYLQTQFADL